MSRYKLGSGKVYHVSPEKPFPPCNKEFPPRAHLKDCWQSQESRSERFAKHRKLSPTTSEHTRKFCANSICQLDTLAIDFSPNICFHVVAGTKLNRKRRHKLYLTHNMFMSWWSFRSSYESIITKLCRLTTQVRSLMTCGMAIINDWYLKAFKYSKYLLHFSDIVKTSRALIN